MTPPNTLLASLLRSKWGEVEKRAANRDTFNSTIQSFFRGSKNGFERFNILHWPIVKISIRKHRRSFAKCAQGRLQRREIPRGGVRLLSFLCPPADGFSPRRGSTSRRYNYKLSNNNRGFHGLFPRAAISQRDLT